MLGSGEFMEFVKTSNCLLVPVKRKRFSVPISRCIKQIVFLSYFLYCSACKCLSDYWMLKLSK